MKQKLTRNDIWNAIYSTADTIVNDHCDHVDYDDLYVDEDSCFQDLGLTTRTSQLGFIVELEKELGVELSTSLIDSGLETTTLLDFADKVELYLSATQRDTVETVAVEVASCVLGRVVLGVS